MNKVLVKKNLVTIVLFIISSLFMNGFYKSLSGFIANNFEYPLLMVTMLITYITPVFCFLFYFYNYYIKPLKKVVSLIYSVCVIILSIISLVLIFINFETYVNNNKLGVYGSIPSIIVQFPYDGIIVSVVLIITQIYNVLCVVRAKNKYAYLKENHYNLGYFKINLIEYLLMSVLAILALFTVGDFVCGLNSISNALYDAKYIFLLLWVLIIPTLNLLSFVFKVERKDITKKNKIIYLSSLILINIIFAVLLLVFEHFDPSFVVAIGKPLFPITFSISFPVELIILLVIQLISVIIDGIKLINYLVNNKHS